MNEHHFFEEVAHKAMPDNREVIRMQALRTTMVHKKGSILMKRTITGACACLALFIAALNLSMPFAKAAADVPVVGALAQVLTFRVYENTTDSHTIHTEVPGITGAENVEIEKKINAAVDAKITELSQRAEQNAKEFKENWLASGNRAEDYKPATIDFSYEVKHSNSEYVSFVITDHQVDSTGAPFDWHYTYNIKLTDGSDLTLESLLGSDYITLCNQQIEMQVNERAGKDENLRSYYQEFFKSKGARGITTDQKFYLNKDGNPVLLFEESEIAPPYAGIQEFVIPLS